MHRSGARPHIPCSNGGTQPYTKALSDMNAEKVSASGTGTLFVQEGAGYSAIRCRAPTFSGKLLYAPTSAVAVANSRPTRNMRRYCAPDSFTVCLPASVPCFSCSAKGWFTRALRVRSA
jgi:hypothetical protein